MKLFRRIIERLFPPPLRCVDPVFGPLERRSNGYWEGDAPWKCPPFNGYSIVVSIENGDEPPTEAQRELFREIDNRYPSLWPTIAAALADYHPTLNTIEAVNRYIDDAPSLHLDVIETGQPRNWSLLYFFDHSEEGDMCYDVEFADWTLVRVSGSD